MILTEESRPSKRPWLEAGPLVFTLRHHHVYRNLIQTQNADSLLPAPPHSWQVATSGRCQGTLPQPVLLNEFSLRQRSGCKSGQIFFLKKETINLIFVIKYVASLWFPPLFFLLLKPTSATKKTIALCTVFSLLGSALHRGNYFEPIKPITRGFLFLSFKFLFFLFFFFSLCHRIQEWGRMLTGPGWVALKVPCPFWCKQTWLI